VFPRAVHTARESRAAGVRLDDQTDYNKDLLFCLRDEGNTTFIGVYHRYLLQPHYPEGDWWPTWRIEAGNPECYEEWNIWESMDLPWDTATLEIEWGPPWVTVKMLETGEMQTLYTRAIMGLSFLGEDDICSNFGWESPARAELDSLTCYQSGPPIPGIHG